MSGSKPVSERRWPWIAAAAALALGLGGWAVKGYLGTAGWVDVGPVAGVASGHVRYLRGVGAFLIGTGSGPLALSARSPHLGHELFFCAGSAQFQGSHGERFDRLGRYFGGPAPRGMDHLAVRVRGGRVEVSPGTISPGPARGEGSVQEPTGALCPEEPDPERPGFAVEGDVVPQPDLYLADAGGFVTERLTDTPEEEFDPSFSPDGLHVAYSVGVERGSEIRIMAVDGSSDEAVIEDAIGPTWSPDGASIAYTALHPRPHLLVADAAGNNTRRLTPHRFRAFEAAWSPDGSMIAFVRLAAGGTSLWLVPASGGKEKLLATPGVPNPVGPAWSPDSARLVFASSRLHELFVIDADGSDLRQITFTQNPEFSPTWSPGDSILYVLGGEFQLYAGNPDDNVFEPVVDVGVNTLGGSWSPDGTQIVFSADR